MAGGHGGRNLRYALLAIFISTVLWTISRGGSSVERGYDVPITFDQLPEDVVITDQSDADLNIRVLGSRAALRNVSPSDLEYELNLSGAKPGRTVHEVDVSRLDVPRGTRIVSRSPSQIEVSFERRGRKKVRVKPEVAGEPGEGFKLARVEVDPPQVWLTGARSRVLRVGEAVTETIDVTGLEASSEREVKLSLGDRVWLEEEQPVVVRIGIEAVEPPEVAPDGMQSGQEPG
jgi:YbbR domain-containing protein